MLRTLSWMAALALAGGAALAEDTRVPDAARALGFGEGAQPVETGVGRLDPLGSADACGACHQRQWKRWSASGHAKAWDNPVFLAGFLREPSYRCVHCHAPRAEQRAEVANALPRGGFLAMRKELLAQGAVPLPSKALTHDGVDCQTCHVRGGQVWTATTVEADGHVRREEATTLGSSEVCAGCHEFQFHALRRGKLELTGQPMQSTYSEWRRWGGQASCLDCHADGNPHALRGTRDLGFLRGALKSSLTSGGLVLESVGVGHHFPTGDLFRHLSVEVLEAQGWRRVAFIGRQYESRPDKETKETTMVLVSDTSLVPGQPRRVSLPRGSRQYRVSYHYVSDEAEAKGQVAPEHARVLLVQGEVP